MTTYINGCDVTIHSLVGRPEINGLRGTVLSYDDFRGRSAVQLEDGQKLWIKASNLEAVYKSDSTKWPAYAALERPRIDREAWLQSLEGRVPREFLESDNSVIYSVTRQNTGGVHLRDIVISAWLRKDSSERISCVLRGVRGIGNDKGLPTNVVGGYERESWSFSSNGRLVDPSCPDQDATMELQQHIFWESLKRGLDGRLYNLDKNDPQSRLHILDPWGFRRIANVLEYHLVQRKRWLERLNLWMTTVDAAIGGCDCIYAINDTVSHLSGALRACEKYESAAILHEEAGENLFNVGHPLASDALFGAGQLWRCVSQFDKEELWYTKALQALSFVRGAESEQRKRQFCVSIFAALMDSYWDRDLRNMSYRERMNMSPSNDMLKLSLCIRMLLISSGNGDHERVKGYNESVRHIATATFMRPGYESIGVQKAWVILYVVAQKATTPAELRSALRYYVREDFKGFLPAKKASDFAAGERYVARSAKKLARSRARVEDDAGISLHAFCDACQRPKPQTELKQCPCKRVFYCDSACQKTHWKHHKKACPLNKKA